MDIPRTEFLQKKRTRRTLLTVVGALVAAAGAFVLARLEPLAVSADRDELLIGSVRRGEFVRRVRGPGVLAPREIRWVAAQAPGRVDRLLLKPGATVEPDTVIVELVNPELERLVQEAQWAQAQGEAELAAARLQLRGQVLDQKANVAEARATYEGTRMQAQAQAAAGDVVPPLQRKQTQLLAEQYGIRAEVEQERLENMEQAAQAQLRAQQARVEQLRNTLERQHQQLASLQVVAGMQGVLQALPVQVGQQLPAGAAIARVAQPDDLVAQLRIPELQAKDLTIGLAAQIDTRTGIVAGRVARVDPAVADGIVRVDIDLSGALPTGVRPDLSVDGIIEIERTPDRIVATRPTYGEPDSQVSVFKLDPDGARARRVLAQFGKESVNEIVVISGLGPGDRIIVSDISQWRDFDELQLR